MRWPLIVLLAVMASAQTLDTGSETEECLRAVRENSPADTLGRFGGGQLEWVCERRQLWLAQASNRTLQNAVRLTARQTAYLDNIRSCTSLKVRVIAKNLMRASQRESQRDQHLVFHLDKILVGF